MGEAGTHAFTHKKKYKYICSRCSRKESIIPVAVIVVGIVTSQSSETPQANGIREEDLGPSVHPYLKGKWA